MCFSVARYRKIILKLSINVAVDFLKSQTEVVLQKENTRNICSFYCIILPTQTTLAVKSWFSVRELSLPAGVVLYFQATPTQAQ